VGPPWESLVRDQGVAKWLSRSLPCHLYETACRFFLGQDCAHSSHLEPLRETRAFSAGKMMSLAGYRLTAGLSGVLSFITISFAMSAAGLAAEVGVEDC
jgi:hypothetical protein